MNLERREKKMDNLLTKTTDLAMYLTMGYVEEGDLAIDATCGNGFDTLMLSEAVGEDGAVVSFDIQESAVEAARKHLRDERVENTIVVHDSFINMRKYIEEDVDEECEKPKAVVFNLGYLPGGNKDITTITEDTLEGVKEALDIIQIGGVVTCTVYSGHEEGKKEKAALLDMAKNLPADKYHVAYVSMPNQENDPPEILMITKKK